MAEEGGATRLRALQIRDNSIGADDLNGAEAPQIREKIGIAWTSGSQVPVLISSSQLEMLSIGTSPNNLLQLDSLGRLPSVDGSQLTNLPSMGAQGAPGPQGAQGSIGSTGTQGVTGDPGAQGSTGAQGATGSQGVQGSQGSMLTASNSTPSAIGTASAGTSAEYARADHTHQGQIAALLDRYEELSNQTFTENAHGGTAAASPTRDIQTAIDATPAGPACQVIVGPGSYAGSGVTIPSGRNNISIVGPMPQDFGGTIASLSSGRTFTVGNNVTRARIIGLQIEGLTTVSTTGTGVHRFERCQLGGGLSIGAISSTIYFVGCEVGAVTVAAGFTGTILFDRCLFTSTFTNSTSNPLRVLMSDSAGLASAPTSTAILNGRFQTTDGNTLYYSNGALLLKTPLTVINALTPAADRLPYFTGAGSAALATFTTFGRSLVDDADAATARTTLGLGTAATQAATAFQPADATLTAIAGLTTSANKLPYFTGTDTATVTDLTSAGRLLISVASAGTTGQVLTSAGGTAPPTWSSTSGGAQGATGAQGAAGAQGASGAQGTAGSRGAQGAQGATGTGLQGSQGSAGAQGLAGGTGAQGAQGPQGPSGSGSSTTGAQGAQGSQGYQGAAGVLGTTGAQGAAGFPATATWSTEWVAASGGALISASGFTLQNLSSGGLKQDSAGNWYEELTSTTAVGRIIHGSLTPSSTTPWEMEWDVACSAWDGGTGLEADEGTGGRRSRFFYNHTSGEWQQASAAQVTGLFDIDTDDRVIMTMRSRPGGMRTYFVDGAAVGGTRYSTDATTQGTARYCWANGGATAVTRTYRVYSLRLLHNSVSSAPAYTRIVSTPVQP